MKRMVRDKKRDVVQFLCCSVKLEDEIFRIYQELANKTNYVDLQSLLVCLAYDSLKHSKMLEELSKHFDRPAVEDSECETTLGQLWTKANDLSTQIFSKVFDDEGLALFVKSVADLENSLSEGYSVFFEIVPLQNIVDEMSQSTTVDLGTLKRTFSIIVADVENHRNLLIDILYWLSAKKMEKAGTSNPAVKYQNPDRWSGPVG
jgi:rubrerythrin